MGGADSPRAPSAGAETTSRGGEGDSGARRVRELDIETWARRDHFTFFRPYEQPFFGICADVDVTDLVTATRQPGGASFFLASLWLSLVAINEIEELRLRIREGRVVVHDVVDGGSTVLRADDTFGFGYFPFRPDFPRFAAEGRLELERVRTGRGLDPRPGEDGLVYYSVLPWVSFTAFRHAHRHDRDDSVPRVVFGRYRDRGDGRLVMPVSLEVHHALADGLHAGRFFQRFEALLAVPPKLG